MNMVIICNIGTETFLTNTLEDADAYRMSVSHISRNYQLGYRSNSDINTKYRYS